MTKCFIRLATITALAGSFTLSASAQDMAKPDIAKTEMSSTAPSPSAAVLSAWNDIGRKLIAMAEDLPDDDYNFKPRAEQRSFSEQLIHAAGSLITSPT